MAYIKIINEGVIYRNPDPGYRYVFASHPHPRQLGENELICTYQRGQAHYAPDLTFALARSTDGGNIWHDEGKMGQSWNDARPCSYYDPYISRLGSTLVIAAFRTDRTDPDKPQFNEETGGLVETETLLIRSHDGGKTWLPPDVVKLPDDGILTPSTPIIELANGQWFWAFDRWHHFDEPGPYLPRMVGLFSSDEGKSWSNPINNTNNDRGKGFWHGKVIRLRDDRLYAMFWSAELSTLRDLPIHYSLGSADGRKWSEPAPTNLPGQTHYPAELSDGTFAAIYTVRESEHPGLFVALSQDGREWDIENQVRVWDATGRDKLGVSAPDAYPRSHDTIAFGAPSLIALDDGDLLAAFWCTEMSITHLRYVRLRVL